MSTLNSPRTRQRLKKLEGRNRVQINLYISPEDATELENESERTGLSRSAIIARRYAAGRQAEISHN